MKLPEQYVKNMTKLLGKDYERYENCLAKPSFRAAKFNTNFLPAAEIEKLVNFPFEKIERLKDCYRVLTSEKLGNSLCHHLGLIYLQEPSSMLAAEALEVKEGERVLDLCAAPGGKSSQILSKNKTGVVVLNEISRERANTLLSNIERQGFKNAVVTSTDPATLTSGFDCYFDKILVDAPCSGEGMFRRDEETINEWKDWINEFNHARQLKILDSAAKMLKKGGTLVYSTCTFSPVEDEDTIFEFLKDHDFSICALPKNVQRYVLSGQTEHGAEYAHAGRVYPFNGFGEGQFVAKLIKNYGDEEGICAFKPDNAHKVPKNELKIAKELLKDCINDENFEFYKAGNSIFISKTPLICPPKVVLCGVNLGTISGQRIVPHHQFFKAFGQLFKQKLVLQESDARVSDFILGLEIETEFNSGYVCVLVNSVPLGGGKAVNGRLKNYYPKGLRKKTNNT